MTEKNIRPKSSRKRIEGVVISDKSPKSRVIETERLRRHRYYSKVMRHSKKFYAHDEKEISKTGDKVVIEESRPMSKLKRWRVIKVKGNRE